MAEMNRFFRPTQSKYQSQFVPETLPAGLMAKMLYAKQAKADQMMAKAVKLGEFEQAALAGHDTDYVEGIKSEVEQFTTAAMTEDRTSPEFQRKYLELTNRIKNDDNLKLVQASVDRDISFQERQKELAKAGNYAQVRANAANYLARRAEYTKKGGRGFQDGALNDDIVEKGVDVWEGKTKYFKELKESGSEWINELSNGIAYKKGFTGLKKGRISEQLKATFDDYLESPAGRQEKTQVLYNMGLTKDKYNALSGDKKKEVNAELSKTLQNDFMEAGLTYVRGKSTTNKDVALRQGHTEAREDGDNPLFITAQKTHLEQTAGATRDKQIKGYKEEVADMKAAIKLAKKNSGDPAQIAKAEQLLAATEAKLAQEQKEHSQAWQDTKAEVIASNTNTEEWNKVSQIQQDLLNGLPAEVAAVLQERIASNMEVKDEKEGEAIGPLGTILKKSQSTWGKGQVEVYKTQADRRLAEELANGDAAMENTIRGILRGEKNKEKLSRNLDRQIKQRWNDKFYTRGQNASVVNIETFTAPPGKGSTMRSIDQSVESNAGGFKFWNDAGDMIPGAEIAGRVKSFTGGSYTIGAAANEDNFGARGTLVYNTPVISTETGEQLIVNGKPQFKEETMIVTAVPQGANQQFNRNNIAKDMYMEAEKYKANGDAQNWAAAIQIADGYRMFDTQQDLLDLERDPYNDGTIITQWMPTGDGRSGPINVSVDKNKLGGFDVKFGKQPKVHHSGSVSETLSLIEEQTK